MSEDELTVMRQQYPYATTESHMLVDGKVRLRCGQCKTRPIPLDWSFVALCDECLTERLAAT